MRAGYKTSLLATANTDAAAPASTPEAVQRPAAMQLSEVLRFWYIQCTEHTPWPAARARPQNFDGTNFQLSGMAAGAGKLAQRLAEGGQDT